MLGWSNVLSLAAEFGISPYDVHLRQKVALEYTALYGPSNTPAGTC